MSTRARGWLFVSLQMLLIAALALLPTGQSWRVPRPLRLASSAARLLGAVSIVWGIAALGRAASVHPEPTQAAILRQTGPYGLVRHPIYSGILVVAATISLGSANAIALPLYAGLAGVLSLKARFEENLLRTRFPGYAAYASVTPRFIPRVRRHRRRDAQRA